MTSMMVRSKPSGAAPFDELVELVLVDALERDGVDLDRQPRGLGGGQTLQHLLEPAPAGDGGEFLRIQGVDGDIDPPHAAGGELPA